MKVYLRINQLTSIMTLERIIAFYVELYPEATYSYIAQAIIEAGLSQNYSHRTLRLKVSEYVNQLEQDLEDEADELMIEDALMLEAMENEADEIAEEYAEYINNVTFENMLPITMIDEEQVHAREVKRYVVMGCVHLPFHNKAFFNAAMNFLAELASNDEIDGLILNGDIIDMHSISRHNKGKITIPGLTLEIEYKLSNQELDRIDEVLSLSSIPVEKHFLYGNHEMWYYDYMSSVDANKLGQGVIKSPTEALRLIERGYAVQHNYKTAHVIIGDSEVHHGTYVNKHASFAHANAMRRSNVFNHTHRTGSYLEEGIFVYNLGWMGDKNARVFGYMDRIQKETWTNGLGVITVDEDNISHVEQVTWKNNKFIYGGIFYEG
jgi:hypothetical protein